MSAAALLTRLRRQMPRRFPLVRQYDQADCGPAALLTVLRYWGGDTSLVHVRQLTRTDAHGSTLYALVEAARSLGFDARGASGSYDDLRQQALPCIAHVIMEDRLHHFVVVRRVEAERILIADPAGRTHWLSREEFTHMWRQRAVVLLNPTPALLKAERPSWLRWILAYFRREETWLVQSLFLGLAYTMLGLLTAVFVQWLIDRFIPDGNHEAIVVTGLILLVLQLLRAGAAFLRQRFMVELNKRVSVQVNTDFLGHLFRLPLGFFDSRKTGDITARIHDSIKIQSALLLIFGTTVIDGLVIAGSLAFIFLLAPPLGWLALAALPVYGAVLLLATRRVRGEQNEVMKGYSRVEASYIDSLSGIREIRGYEAGSVFAGLNAHLFTLFQQRTERLGLTQARVTLFAELTGGALVIGGLIFGAVLVVNERLLLGQMVAAYSLIGGMIPSTNRLVEAHISLQGAGVAATRLMDLLLVEPEADTGSRAFRMQRTLELRDARFSWPKGTPLLEGLSLTLERGRITGLWGASGAGKTTLVKLLQRAYSLGGGALLLDGEPADDISLAEYRANVAVVPESVKIFSATLADNLLLGRTVGSVEELQARISATGLEPVLARFPAGLLTPLGEEGRQLSSGERQLVGLMRALLFEPAVLVLDEGVNAIDVNISRDVHAVLRAYARDHAVLLISHSLRTLQRADYLYLMEGGRIGEQGPPRELVERESQLRELWHTHDLPTPTPV